MNVMESVMLEVEIELLAATKEFGAFTSVHEGLAVIQEEFEELKAEVFKKAGERNTYRMHKEAKHTAAMAIRFMIELTAVLR